MKPGTAQKISNAFLSCAAGLASFLFSRTALVYLTEFDEKILAALAAGVFCLLIRYIAAERPNSENAHALGMYDPVTSLPNRLHFRSEVDKSLARCPTVL